MRAITYIDFLGDKPTLKIASKNSNQTLFGGILSLITIGCLMTGLGYFSYILISRTSFSVIANEQLNIKQISPLAEFPLIVGLADKLGRSFPDQDKIFGVLPLAYTLRPYFVSNMNQTMMDIDIKTLKIQKCSPGNTPYPKYEYLINQISYFSGECLLPGQDTNLYAPFGYDNQTYLTFYFYKCKNISEIGKTDCYPDEVINEKLKDFWLVSFFKDYSFDHNNINDPGQPYIRREMVLSTKSEVIVKEMTIMFQNVDYRSDDNFLISTPNTTPFTVMSSKLDVTNGKKESVVEGAFTTITFEMSTIKKIYDRKFYKLQNMLADLGGLAKALVTIFMNVNILFSNKTFYNKIIDANINSLYIKSIKKSLLQSVVGGIGKKRGTSCLTDNVGKIDQDDQDKAEKIENEFNNNGQNIVELNSTRKNDEVHDSPKRFIHSNKTFVSEMGLSTEKVPVKDGMTRRSDDKNSRTIIELQKISSCEKPYEQQSEMTIAPSSIEIKKNVNIVYNKFQIDFLGHIFPKCCFKRNSTTYRQLELHEKFTEIINRHLDILYISNMLHLVDKLNFVLCGNKYRNLLETTINPYLYSGDIPSSSDIYEARNEIIASLK